MDMDQLAQELEMLKQESAAGKAEKRMGGFIDKYGTKFNNNTDIANLILAEMDRRGVDEASEAASEAVQQVLDKLREEATTVLDSIKQKETEVSELMDKIDNIQQAVDSAASGQTEAPPPDMGADSMPGDMPPPDMGADAGGGAPPDAGGAPPPDMGGGGAPGGDMGGAPGGDMGGAPPDAGGAPPPPSDAGGGAPPPPPPDPNMVPSDVRIKNIKQKFAAYKASRAATVPSDSRIKAWKPHSETLSALKGLL